MKKNKPLSYDHMIINRVKKYLEDNVDKTYLDVGVMTRQLMERYPEYSRRKIAPFRMLVEHAYRIVSKSYGLDMPSTSPEDSDASDLEVTDVVPSNPLNNMMNDLYSKPKNKQTAEKPTPKSSATSAAGASGEAIDISSEESSSEDQVNGRKNSKNAAPQTKDVNKSNVPKESEADGVGNPLKKVKLDNGPMTMIRTAFNQRSNDVGAPDIEVSRPYNSVSSQMMKPRKYKKEVCPRKVRQTFQDIGGMEKTLKEICELLIHMKAPDIYLLLGLVPPRGILLHGPSGCGKTLLAQAIAGQLNLPFIDIPATELIAGISGESEERIRDVFEQATQWAPCILFIDEIDAISSNRANAQKDMERRVVTQLISSLDNLKASESGQTVVVIGATTKPDLLDPALRRVGRFDHEIAIGIPNRKDRKDILTVLTDGLAIDKNVDFDKISELTPGYVGADLLALVTRAGTVAVKKKCAEEMRAYQKEVERNITVVDLDDDDETPKDAAEDATNKSVETTSVEDKPSETAQVVNVNGVTQSEPNAVESMDVDEDAVRAAEKTEPVVPAATESKSDEAANEVSTTNVVSEKNEKAKPEVNVQRSTAHTELSLLEWLNWLENPLDITSESIDFCITMEDFIDAVKVVQPSAKREGFVTVPDVTWNDIGSLEDIRKELKLAVLAPVKYPELLERLGLTGPSGVLLCGPPGCGKTLLAKAVANEAGINFISVKGPELMNMYVGESERAVRACFQRARNSAPCVIFFDEFDSLCPKRSEGNDSGSGTRIVNQLLTEMDGVEHRQGVYILAATNRPDIIDPAILRPGRLDKVLYVGMPQLEDRVSILNATTKNRTRPALDDDVDLMELAKCTEDFTGADLACLVKEAALAALRESLEKSISVNDLRVRMEHFQEALRHMRPSVGILDRKMYERLRLKYASSPTTTTTSSSTTTTTTKTSITDSKEQLTST